MTKGGIFPLLFWQGLKGNQNGLANLQSSCGGRSLAILSIVICDQQLSKFFGVVPIDLQHRL